jgi:hypothetical protein
VINNKIVAIILLLFISNNVFAQKVVRYDLYVNDTIVNFSGKTKRAIAVNGRIPMPTLTFTEGDTAEIYVHNQLNESTSLHWHGLFLPNQYDGIQHTCIVFLLYNPVRIGIIVIAVYKSKLVCMVIL